MIHNKSCTTNTFYRHLDQQRNKAGKAKRVLVAGLMLTSMVDMFSLLVIFLLQSFSSNPVQINLHNKITLPAAVSGAEIKDTSVLIVSDEDVILDQKLLGNAKDLLKQPQPLLEALGEIKSLWMKAHPSEPFKGEINLQADRAVSSVLVSRFIDISMSQGFPSIHLAVADGNK